jgi:hypothetical protein
MPVLVHFSRAVYDKLGHELVDYLNQLYDVRAGVDALRRDVKRRTDDVNALALQVIERLPLPRQTP